MTTVKDVLVEGRRKLNEIGWVQGVSCKWSSDREQILGYCAAAAIEEYHSVDAPRDCLACKAAYHLVTVNSMASLPSWNDNEGRTKEEVIAAFDKAIASLE